MGQKDRRYVGSDSGGNVRHRAHGQRRVRLALYKKKPCYGFIGIGWHRYRQLPEYPDKYTAHATGGGRDGKTIPVASPHYRRKERERKG